MPADSRPPANAADQALKLRAWQARLLAVMRAAGHRVEIAAARHGLQWRIDRGRWQRNDQAIRNMITELAADPETLESLVASGDADIAALRARLPGRSRGAQRKQRLTPRLTAREAEPQPQRGYDAALRRQTDGDPQRSAAARAMARWKQPHPP